MVVGAGPAGAACARLLAERGRRVLILDRLRPPRYKTCGGGIVGRAWRRLDAGARAAAEAACHDARLGFLDTGLVFRVVRPEPVVVMAMRAELDRRLLVGAEAAGAELAAPAAFIGFERRGERLEVASDGGRIVCRYLVGADGADSRVARAGGWPRGRRVPALESEIEVGDGDLRRFGAVARFDFGTVERGYAWVFPKRRHLSVGCLSRARRPNLKRALAAYLERLGIEPRRRQDHGSVIPIEPRARRLAREGVLLVGDAAGLADPVTCEGISNALASGELAARSLDACFDSPRRAARAYDRSLRRDLLPELRAARLLAAALYDAPRLRRLAFGRAGQGLSEAMTGVVAGASSYRELLRAPATYRRLGAVVLGTAAGGGRATSGRE